ncbi:MAG: hypothetical protein ACLPXB_19910 [Thiobacillaceae bacterium]
MEKETTGYQSLNVERRRNDRLRAIFPRAHARIVEFFHGRQDWVDGSIDYLAQRVVHEAYPDLSTVEIHTLLSAIKRHRADRVREYLYL